MKVNQLARLEHRYSKHMIQYEKHCKNGNTTRAQYHLFMANQILNQYGKLKYGY